MSGLGTVYKKTRPRHDGGQRTFWVAQIRMAIDGTTHRIEGQGQTKDAAIEARERAVARALAGTTRTPHPTARGGTLLAEMTKWNDTRDVMPRTREHVQSVIRSHIAPEKIGGMAIHSIHAAHIELLLDTRASEWVKLDVYKTLRAWMTYAVHRGLLTADPMKTVARPHMPRAHLANPVEMDKAVKRLTAMLAWMRNVHWADTHPMYWARIMLALDGLRPGEARGLRWKDVENLTGRGGTPRIVIRKQLGYAEGVLQLTPVKGEVPRIIMLRGQTAEALRAWKKVHDGLKRRKTWHPRPGLEELVLVSDTGKPVRQQDDSKMWRDILTEAQSRDKEIALWPTAYMRHIAVTLMRDSGVTDSLVATIMGHSVSVEDRHYYQSQPAAQEKAMKKMNRYIVRHTTPHAEKVAQEKAKAARAAARAAAQQDTQDGSQSDSEG